MTVDVDSRPEAAAPSGLPQWMRLPLIVVGVLTLLLIGTASGLLLARSGPPGPVAPAVGSVDVGFAQDMSVHHLQAAQMASWVRDHGTDPVVRGIAFDIEATQTGQVGTMEGWLNLWNAPVLPLGGHMGWMTAATGHEHGGSGSGSGSGSVETMPGMASPDELRQLRATEGPDLDVLFLQLLLRHHEGGADMLRYGAEHATVSQVRNLASQMLRSQSAESENLRQLLLQRGGQPLPV